ncbi:MAG TPA: TPM domain-containing protein [Burkholderiaceae bacterium]|nr:TPM domain-containing protein [Burkholderiaceae bacterium]
MRWWQRLALPLLLLAGLAGAAAQDVLPVPALTERVIDQTGTLSADEQRRLIDKLAAFERDAGPQIVVLMVRTTAPEDIAAYAQRVGETWKIGRRDVGDGLLLVVAKDDRRLWIAPAKALEGAVPDLAARQIARDVISPRFKSGDFAGGIDAGVEALFARIRGEGLPAPAADSRAPGPLGQLPLTELLVFAFVALPVVASVVRRIFGRVLGTLASGGAAGVLAWVVTGSMLVAILGVVIGLLIGLFAGVARMLPRRGGTHLPAGWGGGGWSGGGGWGGGGGGFSSGGGGDFGGGGAGGDW